MEIQTIQSAVAGVYRINEFLAKPEREMVEERALVDSRHTVGKNGAVQELENAQGRAENSSGDTSAASIDLDAAKVNDSGIFWKIQNHAWSLKMSPSATTTTSF